MGKNFKHTSSETKRDIIQKIEKGEISMSEAAKACGVSQPTISRWMEKWRSGNFVDRPTSREKALEKENEKLKQTIGSLYFHIEQLKKMEDYKRRMKSADTSVITEENLHLFRKPAK